MKTGMLENQTTLCEFRYNFIVLAMTFLQSHSFGIPILQSHLSRYENGEEEHCLELWNRDGKVKIFHFKVKNISDKYIQGLRWNDTPCSFETFFVCEL